MTTEVKPCLYRDSLHWLSGDEKSAVTKKQPNQQWQNSLIMFIIPKEAWLGQLLEVVN